MRTTAPFLILLLLCAPACSDDSGGQTIADQGGGNTDGAVADGKAATADSGQAGADAALPATACPPSKALLGKIDAARLLKDLNFLEGLVERRTHASQTKAAALLRTELKKLSGVALREHTYSYQGQSYVNFEITVKCTDSAAQELFMGAHYDSNSNHPTLAPGADDNASGTAAILEVARAYAGCKPKRTVRLLLFSNEEKGTIGAKAYVKDLKATLPSSRLRGFINVDMIAYGPDNEDLDIATRTKYKALADDMAKAAAFLLSDDASYINNASLMRDGGLLALPPW